MNSKDYRNLQEAYLDVYDEGYKSFPDEKVRAKAKKLAPNRDDLGRQALDAKQADTTPEKDLNRARKLRLIARTHTSTGPEQVEKRNKGPESLLYKKRSKLVSDNTKKKSFPNRLRRSDGQGISDSYDYYDIILSHLLDEGYADTEEAAERIMVNMSEEWRESIVETRMDPRGRPASGPMNVYANPKGKPSQAHLDAVKSYDAEQKKKTPEQRKKELDDYRERQMNNK